MSEAVLGGRAWECGQVGFGRASRITKKKAAMNRLSTAKNKMKRSLIWLCLAAASSLWAQNFTAVTASKIQDASGALLATGQFCVQAIGGNKPFIYQAGGGGIVHMTPACTTVTNGAITPMSVANSSLTTPTNVTYVITVTDNAGGNAVVTTAPTQITGTSWSFDAYVPTSTPLAIIQAGPTSTVTTNGTSGDWNVVGNHIVQGSVNGSNNGDVTYFGAVGDGATDNSTAFAAASNWANARVGRTLSFPDGTYNYVSGLAFTQPVGLSGGPGAILNYLGTGNAVTMGPAGLTISTYHDKPYIVDGLTFTGGASMAEGIFFNEFVTAATVRNTGFFNFGNISAANVWYQGQNWDANVDRVWMWSEAGHSQYNGIWVNAADPANGTNGDYGQTQLHVTNSHIQNVGGVATGVGIYANGIKSNIHGNNIAGFTPDIRLGGWANKASVIDDYLETTYGSSPCIQYGDPSGVRVGNYLDGVEVSSSYCNVHNTDFSTTAHFVGPTTTTGGVQNWIVEKNEVISSSASQPLIVQNNLFSQAGNRASFNRFDSTGVVGYLHTAGSNIAGWTGLDEVLTAVAGLNVTGNAIPNAPANTIALFQNGADAVGALSVKCGAKLAEYCGLFFYDYAGNQIGGIQASGSTLANSTDIEGAAGIAGLSVVSTGEISVRHGIAPDGGGMKVLQARAVGCTTSANTGAACTGPAISLGTAFADTSYSLTCSITAVGSGQPHIVSLAKNAGSFTVTIAADTASAASGSVDCLAVHN